MACFHAHVVPRPPGDVALFGAFRPAAGRYIVVLKDSASPSAVAGTVTGLGATVHDLFGRVNALLVSLPPAKVGILRHDPRWPM